VSSRTRVHPHGTRAADLIESYGAKGATAEFEKSDVWRNFGNALWDDWGFAGRALTLIALLFGASSGSTC